MKKVVPGQISRWAVKSTEDKHAALRAAFLQHHGAALETDPRMQRFLAHLDATPGYRLSAHYYRYLTTFMRLLPHLPEPGAVIVETGGSSPILDHLAQDYRCYTTTTDLRYRMDCDDEVADLVLSFEVLEHIKDQNEENLEAAVLFRGTGTAAFAGEIGRTLRRGGRLVLTTPNAVSARAYENLVDGRAPMVYRPHVREYTADEVREIFAALTPVEHDTLFNFFYIYDNGLAVLTRLAVAEVSTEDRGDDHFFVFRKD